jgi:hypothetical protein
MKRLAILTAFLLAGAAGATNLVPRAALVVVRPDGTIAPTGAVASINQLAATAAAALAAQAAAEAAAAASADLSNDVDRIEGEIATQQQHAIFRGWVMSFASAVEPVTNCAVQILDFRTRTQGTTNVADLFTWFEVAPTSAPAVTVRASLLSGAWTNCATLSNSWPNTINVTTTGAVYACYQQTVVLPAGQTGAFYRVNGAVQFITGDEDVLPVYGGLTVNGLPGLTTNIVNGAVTNRYVGGILVP